MNTLDNLLLFIFIAVFLFYCYKKKKFFFSKLRKEPKTENEEQKTAQGIQMPAQIIPFNLQGMQAPVNYTPASIHTSQCKFIPWAFYPVFDMNTEKTQADAVVSSDVAALERVLNEEIRVIASQGYIITGIHSVSYDLGDPSIHVLYCITYGR